MTGMVRIFPSAEAALADLPDGAVVAIGGYAGVGVPESLVRALLGRGPKGLTCICQGAWPHSEGGGGIADLIEAGLVARLISPMPFPEAYKGPGCEGPGCEGPGCEEKGTMEEAGLGSRASRNRGRSRRNPCGTAPGRRGGAGRRLPAHRRRHQVRRRPGGAEHRRA